MASDEKFMRRALKLALKGTGRVSPNPRVGCVITRDEEIIAEGWHREFGGPHAEIEAIRNAGMDDFSGCTMYVTLEPCSHEGKTPPCAPVVAEAGFSRVVIGMEDPNPQVQGSGIQMLKERGIEVETGVLEEECRWVNRFFIKNVTTGLPYVMLKVAQSLDGCLATARGESKWITGEESRRRAHMLRAEFDAVLVGSGTAQKDDPSLTVRNVKGRNPYRIVVDTNLSLPLNLNLFKENGRGRTIICFKKALASSRKAENLKMAGINLLPVPADFEEKINITNMLYELSEQFNIASIMIEGGPEIHSSFLKDGLADELQLFIAPKVIGKGMHAFGQHSIYFLEQAPGFDIKSVSRSGDDIHIIAVKKG
ncbi:MAG: bifunctional diaminohydroxyphosphoribosylaminopyrimidine deaminase/5-amino-6-(5-phosphoribosylamino)uracil reductase RibD [Candidatus Kapaibacterium sp.]